MDEVMWYENNSLESIKNIIKDNINKTEQSFIAIGYYLKYVKNYKLYISGGYKNIWDFSLEEFNFSRSWTSRCMAVNSKFSIDGNSPVIQDRFKDYSKCLLSEMLNMNDELMLKVRPTTTRVEIRDLKSSRIEYCEADIDKELDRRTAKFEALQDDNFIQNLRKRAQIKRDAVVLLKENVSTEKQEMYCPHCHMLIKRGERYE